MKVEQISGQQGGFFQLEVSQGSRVVRITANDVIGPFNLRLYVGNGEIVTRQTKRCKTLKGAVNAAGRMLEGMAR